MSKICIAVGQQIKARRKAMGKRQVDVAMGLKHKQGSYLSLIENGKKNPGIKVLMDIAHELNCTVSDLLKAVEVEAKEKTPAA